MRATCLPSFPPSFPLSLPRSCPFYPFKLRTTTTDDLARYCATAGVGWLVGTYVRTRTWEPAILPFVLPSCRRAAVRVRAHAVRTAAAGSLASLPAPSLPGSVELNGGCSVV